jgi:hypothetical protein
MVMASPPQRSNQIANASLGRQKVESYRRSWYILLTLPENKSLPSANSLPSVFFLALGKEQKKKHSAKTYLLSVFLLTLCKEIFQNTF